MGAAKTITNYSKSGGLKVCRDQTSTKYQLHIIPFTVSVYLQQNVPANLSQLLYSSDDSDSDATVPCTARIPILSSSSESDDEDLLQPLNPFNVPPTSP